MTTKHFSLLLELLVKHCPEQKILFYGLKMKYSDSVICFSVLPPPLIVSKRLSDEPLHTNVRFSNM